MTMTLYIRTALVLSLVMCGALAMSVYAEENSTLNGSVSNTDERNMERPNPAPQRMMPSGYEERENRPDAPTHRGVMQEARPVAETRAEQASDRMQNMQAVRLEAQQAAEARKMELERNRALLQERTVEIQERRANVEENRAERVDMRTERAEERAERVDMRTERAEERAERIDTAQARAFAQALTPLKRGVAILDAAIARMNTITDRIESRVQKIAENGTPVEEAYALIERARTELSTASMTLRAIEGRIDASAETENPREVIADVREALRSVHQSVRGVQAHLRDAVESLK